MYFVLIVLSVFLMLWICIKDIITVSNHLFNSEGFNTNRIKDIFNHLFGNKDKPIDDNKPVDLDDIIRSTQNEKINEIA